MTRKFFFITTSIILGLLVLINLFAKDSFYESMFIKINGSTFEPVLTLVFSLFITSAIMLFTASSFFDKWLKKFLVWYFPGALLLTFTFPTSGYVMPHRYDIAVFLGVLMVFVTLIASIYSRYRPK